MHIFRLLQLDRNVGGCAGATCAYTPMLHARLFLEDPKYRAEHFTTCPGDRPLLVQFCANDPATLLAAAKLVEAHCDGVDLNLGCPQRIAKRGNYGAFLMDDLARVQAMVETLSQGLSVPVTCKIRIFPEPERTLAYAKMLEAAGCQLLAVHGRTDQKDARKFRADRAAIAAVAAALRIPVVANGDVRSVAEADECIKVTGTTGVLSAEPLLGDPRLFDSRRPEDPAERPADEAAQTALEYLQLAGALLYLTHPGLHFAYLCQYFV